MPQVEDPVLIIASNRLHRVGYVISAGGGNAIVQCTAFDRSPLEYPGEARHSTPAGNVVLLRDLPIGPDAGGVLLKQADGAGVLAASSSPLGGTGHGRLRRAVFSRSRRGRASAD
jgi:hypothetical protein